MIKIFNIRLLSLICFVMSFGIVTSCKKESSGSDKIELINFGPTGARHGDTLRFFGNNLNRVTSIEFTGAGATVAQPAFIQQTSELILLKVPNQAEKGFVTLKTPEGDIVSKTIFNLNVAFKVATMTAQARPGDNITLTGDFMNWVRRVEFEKGKVVTTFVSQSLNQLVLKVPDDAQTGPLIISYAGTDSTSMQTKDTLKVTLPVATAVSPSPVKHQTNLTITGTNLDLTKQILFTGVTAPVAAAAFVSQSATQIVVKVPASTQKGKVSLVAASGVATQSPQDLDVVLPAITSIAPNPIDAETNLTITGTNLDIVSGISFTGGTAPITSFVSQSATQIVVKVPKGTLKGKLIFGVLNSTLTVESTQVLDIKGGLPPLSDFTLAIYTDALQNGFQDWSYTDTHDFNSTAVVRQGTKSIKAIYGGNTYQGITFHANTGVSTAGYTKLEFSVFTDASLAGKKLQVITNGNYGGPAPQVTFVGGEWTTYSVTLASMGNPTTISEIVLQAAGFVGTVHIDHVGLR